MPDIQKKKRVKNRRQNNKKAQNKPQQKHIRNKSNETTNVGTKS